jgi:L-fucose isomerase-like protein
MINNIPQVKLGLVAVSRDCFVISLSRERRETIAKSFTSSGGSIYEAKTIVENENDMLKAVKEVQGAGCNALVVFLGNFGPETPETLIAKNFDGPVMFVAAAEESYKNLINGRGDAYCGMLNCSYNLGLRHIPAVIPSYPVGTADDIAKMISDFLPVARAVIGLKSLKVITFGPRPQDFFACNAPIQPLYDLGIEVQENSELDLFNAYKAHESDKRIPEVVASMAKELGQHGNTYPDLLNRLAQFEITLLDWAKGNKGSRDYVVFANKCWPAFPKTFGFEPCYVNSRLTESGMPVACEVDIYGAVSEYIGACISGDAVTLLDINNSVPEDLYKEQIKGKFRYALSDTFMGFHCGNTPFCKLSDGKIKYQLIQNRLLENGNKPDFTRGTLEGDIAPSDVTLFRMQGTADSKISCYIAQGEVLPVATHSFGSIGVFAIPEMGRFYRNVLIEKHFPHHGAVAFSHIGKPLYTLFRYLGLKDISFNQPKGMLYASENPFEKGCGEG